MEDDEQRSPAMHSILTVTTLSGLVFLVLGLIEPALFHTSRLRVAVLGLILVAGGFAGFVATLPEADSWSRVGRRIFQTRNDAEDAAREIWAGIEARTRALEAERQKPEGAAR
jgi:hypothetical protein